jgi:regulator of protease activity HflC (stomatin/prohibitin superfamily)
MQPGMQWTGLFTHVESYDLRIRQATVEMLTAEQTAVDKDGQSIKARIQINYRLNPESVVDTYSKVGLDRDLATILNLDGIVREGMKTVTAKYESTYIWQNRNEIKEEAIKMIENNFPKKYFVLENVIIPDIDFNPAFMAAIEAQKTNEKLALAKEKEVAIAKFEAERAVQEAKGTAEAQKIAVIAQGEADAMVLKLKREQITPELIQNNWITKWDGKLPQFIMSSQSSGLLMQLPSLNKENKGD